MKIKYFYPATLIFLTFIILIALLYIEIGNNSIWILKGLVRNFSYIHLGVSFFPVFFMGALWIWLHLDPSIEVKNELKIKKDVKLAWWFPEGSIVFKKQILGMVPADWFFLAVNVPLGYLVWCAFDVTNLTLPYDINLALMIIFLILSFIGFYLAKSKISYSCRIACNINVIPYFPILIFYANKICFLRFVGLLFVYTIFILVWDLISRILNAWKYKDNIGIHSKLYSKKIWFCGAPFGVAFIYGWSSWFFTMTIFMLVWDYF